MNKELIHISALCILFLILGVTITLAYQEFSNKRQFNGFYIESNMNKTQIEEYAKAKERKGDGVCINVAYDMTPKVAYETCVHECTHRAYSEILAEKCEDKYETCLNNLFKEWEE